MQSLAPKWLRATAAAAAAVAFELDADFRACPIKGWHWFRNTWGEDRGGGRTHKGTDVISLRGMKLYAMETGRIIQMGWH